MAPPEMAPLEMAPRNKKAGCSLACFFFCFVRNGPFNRLLAPVEQAAIRRAENRSNRDPLVEVKAGKPYFFFLPLTGAW